MNKISLMAVAGFIIAVSVNSFANIPQFKVNFKKMYCGNVEYLGNDKTKRPHLHCGETFMSYKKANGDHANITEYGTCGRTDAVFDDIKANRNAFADYQGIYTALVAFHQAGCPNQLVSE
ncbi:hypothetical protein DGG96_12825 [Legionella qingyii]|uniref:Uncharacterized protein n=2 Tax=Legionella qingyii TaxID=2184757 RepID=A0A317U1G0_9GAMM|nr:hypothetical protein DGG96_12825 [Legionella qingyii]RUR25544.1 hypothetical protein ELY20_03385 [Legionella qingyii]RUR28565.1 hypothetical protein ELY16_02625 [Legionella qingyii]